MIKKTHVEQTEKVLSLVRLFKNKTSRDIISLLGKQGDLTVEDICAKLKVGQPQVSNYLSRLRYAGAATFVQVGKHRHYMIDHFRVMAIKNFINWVVRRNNEELGKNLKYNLSKATTKAENILKNFIHDEKREILNYLFDNVETIASEIYIVRKIPQSEGSRFLGALRNAALVKVEIRGRYRVYDPSADYIYQIIKQGRALLEEQKQPSLSE